MKKRYIWGLIVVLLLSVCCSVTAEQKKTLEGNGYISDAYEIDQSHYATVYDYHLTSNNVGKNLFLTVTASENGTFYFTLMPKDAKVRLYVYDRSGEQIDVVKEVKEGSHFVYRYQASIHEKVTFQIQRLATTSKLEGSFSICFNDAHKPGLYSEIVKEPTCTTAGILSYPCELCNESAATVEIPASGHTYSTEQILVEPTCMRAGVKGVQCTVCGEILSSEALPMKDHEAGAYQIIRNATCTAEGRQELHCSMCNKILDTQVMSALGHSTSEWFVSREASCLQSGLREKKCNACGAALETEQIDALGHSYTDWVITIEATKEQEGEKTRHCIHCGDTQFEKIEKISKFLGIF